MVMTKFSFIADIHERIRLGDRDEKLKQVARLTTAEEAIDFYFFTFPNHISNDPIRMLADEASSYYDVVRNMLPDENEWMMLASESANNGSRNFNCDYVAALLKTKKSFSEVAKLFNEKEARLLWRWALHCKPVISKRAFFNILSKIHSLPANVLQANMNIKTIDQVFNSPDSILGLGRWWEYDTAPAPMRWKAYTTLAPPKDNHLAVMIPEGEIYYAYKGKIRNRAGLPLAKYDGHFYNFDTYFEMVDNADSLRHNSSDYTIIDRVFAKKPKEIFSKRMQNYEGFGHLLGDTDNNWRDIINALTRPDVRCVRLIKQHQEFEPDGIGGYVMHADRTKVFLIANYRDTIELCALDGVSEYVPVGETHDENVKTTISMYKQDCYVVEVAAVRVSAKGQLLDFTVVGVRKDLGIGDVTQFTELVERGMS